MFGEAADVSRSPSQDAEVYWSAFVRPPVVTRHVPSADTLSND